MSHALFVVFAGDYHIEVAARPSEFPPDPLATQHSYLHHQINNSGDILFSAHWRDGNSVRRSAIYAGPPGSVSPVVEGGDPIAEFPGFYFTGGPDRVSNGNFPAVTFNSRGEVWFNGFIYGDATSGDLPFGEGFWEASAGNVRLLGAAPDFNPNFSFPFNVGNVPYSGAGRLQWTGSFGGFRMADDGEVIFRGNIGAYVKDVGIEFVFNAGLIIRDLTNGLQVITYPGDAVPGTNDWVFNSFGLYHVGHKNAAYVLDATLEGTRTNVNLGQRKRVFFSGRYGRLLPVYTEKDPLPELPPLSEILGTDEPFDLLSTLQGADGTGNFVFSVSASARNRIAGAPMGLWKWDQRAGKLVKVFRFQEPLPTPGGPVRLDTNIAVRAKIGNNKTVFVAAFTGLGYSNPTTGLFQENGTNFTLLAAAGMVVPGTNANFILGANIGSGLVTSDFYANESNDVLFAASFRTNATVGPSFQGMWASRGGSLHSVIRAGQQISLDNTNRTIRSFGYSAVNPVFNDLGMFMANVFVDTSPIIVRASPVAGELPCCESQGGGFRPFGQAGGPWRAFADPAVCDLFTFTGDLATTNWHSPNWDDGRGQPHCDPPGDAAPNTARVVIPGLSDVVLDQRPAPIGSLDSGGHLTLRDRLTVNKTATATDLVVDGPSGGVILTNGAQMTVDVTLWKTGTLSMADGQIPASFASLDTFIAESGSIEALSGNPVFENYGTFRKDGAGEFTVRVPYNIVQPAAGISRTEVLAGLLRLAGGGIFESDPVFHAAVESTLDLSGEYQLLGAGVFFDGDGIVNLGSPDRPFIFDGSQRSSVTFRVRNNAVSFYRGELRGAGSFINENNFVWSGGTISLPFARFFDNKGPLQIEPGPQARKMSGTFRHLSGFLNQRADVDLSDNGVLLNQAEWSIIGPCRIIGSNGLFNLERNSELRVELASAGLVEIESSLRNQDATILVSSFTGLEEATLRLKNVENVQNGTLSRGTWRIATGGQLETPGAEIEHVALGLRSRDSREDYPTRIIYSGRGWAQFRPKKNEGHIEIATNLLLKTLVNDAQGKISIKPMGKLEIQGDFVQVDTSEEQLDEGADQTMFFCEGGQLIIGEDFLTAVYGQIRNGALVEVKGQLINSGSLHINEHRDESRTEVNISDVVINNGSISLGTNSIFRCQGGFSNTDGPGAGRNVELTLKNAQASIGGNFSNENFVLVDTNSTLTVFGNMVSETDYPNSGERIWLRNRGALNVGGDLSVGGLGTSLRIDSYAFLSVGGLLRVSGAVELNLGSIQVGETLFTDQAVLAGTGIVDGNVTVHGLTSIGFSPGALSILGNLNQTNSSVLVIEVAGTATNQFDRLLVSQTASIGGTLAINVLEGFRPSPNDKFSILEAGVLTNQFANATNGQRLATFGGFGSFVVNYTPTNVFLSAFEANPTPAPTAPATLNAPTLGLDSLQLKLTGTAGRDYLIETSTNLVTWSIAKTNVAGFNGESSIELPLSADYCRFFRAKNRDSQ